MRKNYMAKVAKLLGVELGESFKITSYTEGDYQNYYRLTENNCLEMSDDGVEWKMTTAAVLLKYILMGDIRIVKLPWKPAIGVEYYIPSITLAKKHDIRKWYNIEDNQRHYNLGIVCKTREEAVALTEKMLVAINEQ